MRTPHSVAAKPKTEDTPNAPASAPSKSQLKREMQALQELGVRLAELPEDRINALDVPDSLRLALRDMQRIQSHEGRRRHAQYIGKLMRQIDPAPLQRVLLDASGQSRAAVAQMHRLEQWRERLLNADDALSEFLQENPHADAQALRQLVRAARSEKAAGKPPRQYRVLFQTLKSLLEPQNNASDQ